MGCQSKNATKLQYLDKMVRRYHRTPPKTESRNLMPALETHWKSYPSERRRYFLSKRSLAPFNTVTYTGFEKADRGAGDAG